MMLGSFSFVIFLLGIDAVTRRNTFVTIFYDYGKGSDEILLATRVLMKSIHDTQTAFRRMVILPQDGARLSTLQLLKGDGIEVHVSSIPNAYRYSTYIDNAATLRHMKNMLILWDDPELKTQFDRLVYLDAENLLIRNMDEIFNCGEFCAVDSGQSVVYSNSLFVITPRSVRARAVFDQAIRKFESSGRRYGYTGITQGFVPGLFEAIEESPFFNVSSKEQSSEIVKRLPFYYSINHMVYYERLNWDLYQCNNPNNQGIPGPLLSFKYSGSTIRPWFWISFVYFNINWNWLRVRETLFEDHFSVFFSSLLYASAVPVVSFVLLLHVLRWCRSRIDTRHVYGTSFDDRPSYWAIVRGHWATHLIWSVFVVAVLHLTSLYAPPHTMHPLYACKVWLFWQTGILLGVLVLYRVGSLDITLSNTEQLQEVSRLAARLSKELLLVWLVQLLFLYATNEKFYSNPVQKPVTLICLLATVILLQLRLLVRHTASFLAEDRLKADV